MIFCGTLEFKPCNIPNLLLTIAVKANVEKIEETIIFVFWFTMVCNDVILIVFQNLSKTKLMQAWNIFDSVLLTTFSMLFAFGYWPQFSNFFSETKSIDLAFLVAFSHSKELLLRFTLLNKRSVAINFKILPFLSKYIDYY